MEIAEQPCCDALFQMRELFGEIFEGGVRLGPVDPVADEDQLDSMWRRLIAGWSLGSSMAGSSTLLKPRKLDSCPLDRLDGLATHPRPAH